MLLIIAHHYVGNSPLLSNIIDAPMTVSTVTMIIFGAWGKTGINCFVLITGYFMCKSHITMAKLLKLYLQIVFYAVIIYGIFCITGHETFSVPAAAFKLWPVKSVATDFIGCFLIFYLLIPFLNILVNNMDLRQHGTLLAILLFVFTCLPSLPKFYIAFNYVSWFCVLYLLASYIRNYGLFPRLTHRGWGWLSLVCLLLSSCSIVMLDVLYKINIFPLHAPYYLVHDSNKILAVALAVSSFMFFKDMRIQHSRLINVLGASTFGVLLIHANSDAMRQWLWRETVDCAGHFSDSVLYTLSYAVCSVLIIFIVCAGIDWFRGRFIEPLLIDGVNALLAKRRRLTRCQEQN